MKKLAVAAIACMIALVVASAVNVGVCYAADEAWPSRPITIVVPYGAGGDTDFNARIYIEGLSKQLGVPIAVSNMAGSGGAIGGRYVKDAAPDGYTVLFWHTALNVNQAVGTADFGLEDFKLSAVVGTSPGDIIVARKDSGWKDLKDLKEYTQKNPGKVVLGIETGTIVNIYGKQMQEEGLDVTFVDAGGASDRVAALAGGHIDLIINAYGTVKDYLDTGEFIALAQVNKERSAGFPDIPCTAEQGFDVQLDRYYFFAFPKDTPDAISEKFAKACEVVSKDPKYAEAIMNAYRQSPFYADHVKGKQLLDSTKKIIDVFAPKLFS